MKVSRFLSLVIASTRLAVAAPTSSANLSPSTTPTKTEPTSSGAVPTLANPHEHSHFELLSTAAAYSGTIAIELAAMAPSAIENTVATVDFSFDAPVHKSRAVTADGGIPDNLYRLFVSFSEYCDGGTLKARGWVGDGEMTLKQGLFNDPRQKMHVNLHPGWDLVFGPYSYDQHAFLVEYDSCQWSSESGYPCGWCETRPWSLGPLNCQTGEPVLHCLTYRVCYFVDNHVDRKTARSGIRNKSTSSASLTLFKANDMLHTVDPWTSEQSSYQSGAPRPQRLTYNERQLIDTYDHRNSSSHSIALRPTTPSTYPPDVPVELSKTTVTPAPYRTANISSSLLTPTDGVVRPAEASTVVLMPAIIETAHPSPPDSPKPFQIDTILPFHVEIREHCIEASRTVDAVYMNGNMRQAIDLRMGLTTSVQHRVPGYASLEIGPFDYKSSKLRFGYASYGGGCEWWDHETWKSCGECRAGLWSRGPVVCGNPGAMRVKIMDCSVLLGTKAIEEMD